MYTEKLLVFLQYLALLDLKTKDYKVCLYLLGKLSYKKYKKINQRELAEELDIGKADVSNAINKLIDLEILIINPETAYKVKRKELMLKDYEEDKLEEMIEELIEENEPLRFRSY
ncbi:hypothetical protein ACF3MZ_17880 [Paenibacillaceae bacterium WGS1546]|uniref:hypothetical protein n=1 Tax=Cohnella sp. WGS1546 TaxID=3366810 RepID=UPI00372D1688